jgi:hypothetical protein
VTRRRGVLSSAPAFRPEERASPGQALATPRGGAQPGHAIRFREGQGFPRGDDLVAHRADYARRAMGLLRVGRLGLRGLLIG